MRVRSWLSAVALGGAGALAVAGCSQGPPAPSQQSNTGLTGTVHLVHGARPWSVVLDLHNSSQWPRAVSLRYYQCNISDSYTQNDCLTQVAGPFVQSKMADPLTAPHQLAFTMNPGSSRSVSWYDLNAQPASTFGNDLGDQGGKVDVSVNGRQTLELGWAW